MEETNNRKPASKAFVLSLFTITIILILLLFFIFCKMMPRGGFDIDSISVRQDSGEIQYQYSGGDWKKIISLDELRLIAYKYRASDEKQIQVARQQPLRSTKLTLKYQDLINNDPLPILGKLILNLAEKLR